ncbi:hypothetical protein TSUD_330980 [Trifolium subterraneum]|nr:hypothetical protein TSUD_330980 [Trifolium subterraneum]
MDLQSLFILLLDTRLGNFEASVNCTEPCKNSFMIDLRVKIEGLFRFLAFVVANNTN